MARDRPPQHSDKRIYDAYIAGRQSAALAAAVRVGLFDALDRRSLSPGGLARELGLSLRGVGGLCRALLAMGLLEREGEGLRLAPDAAAHLVRGRPLWLGGLIDLEVENFLSPQLLIEALKRGRASVYGEEDPWQRHTRDSEAAAAFTRAMHSISAVPAEGFAQTVEARGVRRVLDLGGGSGALAIALARRFSELRCTVLDLPSVCELAREFAARAGVADRVDTLAADFWRDPLPSGYDAVILAQILHDWSPQRGAELLAKVVQALPRGGRIWIHEKLVAEDGSGELANQLVDLDMLVWTEGQQYSETQLRALLEGAGFGAIECRPTAGYWSLVSAKPV